MAIYNGPLASKMRGKVGEIVAAKTVGGQTALRAYQPKVKNPNTKRQQNSRNRFGIASKLAAALGAPITIGYAMASKGLKMYPRNMFVRGIVPMSDNPVIEYNGTGYDVRYALLEVSKRAGISELPNIGSADFSVAGKISVPVTVATPSFDLEGGSMGIVVVAYFPGKDASIVKQTVATLDSPTTVQITVPNEFSGETAHLYVFSKVVPASMNEIDTADLPWKFPSETSGTVYAGAGDVQ